MEHLLEDRKKLVCEEDRVSVDNRLDACQQFAKEAQTREEKMSSASKCKNWANFKWIWSSDNEILLHMLDWNQIKISSWSKN